VRLQVRAATAFDAEFPARTALNWHCQRWPHTNLFSRREPFYSNHVTTEIAPRDVTELAHPDSHDYLTDLAVRSRIARSPLPGVMVIAESSGRLVDRR
jgi:hypothetical protein